MSTHDPISDLITRIRNAQMRNKSKVSTPGSRMRANVLEVLKSEGYIRGYATLEHAGGRSEIEIELKYADGEPVIREIDQAAVKAFTHLAGPAVGASVGIVSRRSAGPTELDLSLQCADGQWRIAGIRVRPKSGDQ